MTLKLNSRLLMDKVLGKWPFKATRRAKLIAVVVLVLVAIVTLYLGFAVRKSSAVQYKTGEVRKGELTVIVTATGTLQPTNKVDVGSELSGTIKTVEVDYNSRVRAGQVLARLDTTKLEATIAQSRAALDAAKAKVLQAQATLSETRAKLAQYQKVRQISAGKVPSQTDMDAAQAAFDRAKADLANCEATVSQSYASLKANLTDLSKSVIKSPINGIVLTRSIEPGQTVAASMTTPVLFTLAEDLTKMDLHVNVDEADIGKVAEKQKATFSVAAYANRSFEAEIKQARFGSSTTSGVVTYETVLTVSNPDLSLRPGMTATADIVVKKLENIILIPSAALRFTPPVQQQKKSSPGLIGSLLPRPPKPADVERKNVPADKQRKQIWILRDKKLIPVAITVGESNGGMTEVVSGNLEPGMVIVTDIVTGAK